MSSNVDSANDYALAKQINDRVINIFTLVVDHASTPDLTAVNRSYVLLVNELQQIYARQPELQKVGYPICWRVLDNLEQIHETAVEYTHSGSDYGEDHNSGVSRLCIMADKENPDLTPQLQMLLEEADSNIAEFKSELDKMYAALSFEGISIPVVKIGETTYHFTTMREGMALNIIAFCLKNHPNQEIDINVLRAELIDAKISVSGINNLKENTRNSIFGEKDVLHPFVSATPKAIKVSRVTSLTDQQIEAIKTNSK
ncbi:MAG TPA: hypothetical protein VIH90_01790 [Candidatus Saccharimonadales bacterium]